MSGRKWKCIFESFEGSVDEIRERWETVAGRPIMARSDDVVPGSGGSQSLLLTRVPGGTEGYTGMTSETATASKPTGWTANSVGRRTARSPATWAKDSLRSAHGFTTSSNRTRPNRVSSGTIVKVRESPGGRSAVPRLRLEKLTQAEHQRPVALPLHVASGEGHQQGLVGSRGGCQEVHRSPDAVRVARTITVTRKASQDLESAAHGPYDLQRRVESRTR
jgi:hypothetical protein